MNKISEVNFDNSELRKVAEMAISMGLRVWTFESSSNTVKQIFFDNGVTFGTASESFGGVTYGTCHKACRSCGTGFGIGSNCESANRERIEETLRHAPAWAGSMARDVVKETFEKHISNDRILKYYELV